MARLLPEIPRMRVKGAVHRQGRRALRACGPVITKGHSLLAYNRCEKAAVYDGVEVARKVRGRPPRGHKPSLVAAGVRGGSSLRSDFMCR